MLPASPPSSTSRSTRPSSTAMTQMADRIEIVSAERVRDELVKLILSPRPRVGLSLLVQTGLAEQVLPELPRLALEIDEHHRHKDVYEHTLTVLEQAIDAGGAGAAGSGPATGRAAARHRQAQDAPVRVGRRGLVPPPRGGRRQARGRPDEGAALPQRRHRRRGAAGRAAPALPRLRDRRVDRLGGAPLRLRRRPAARPAAQADPLGQHDPQPAQGRDAAPRLRPPRGADRPAARAGGAGLDPARPRRQRDHGDPRRATRSARRPGLAAPQGGPARPRPPDPRGSQSPSCARWWADQPRSSHPSGAPSRPVGPRASGPVSDAGAVLVGTRAGSPGRRRTRSPRIPR